MKHETYWLSSLGQGQDSFPEVEEWFSGFEFSYLDGNKQLHFGFLDKMQADAMMGFETLIAMRAASKYTESL